jgi:hypothetical protein
MMINRVGSASFGKWLLFTYHPTKRGLYYELVILENDSWFPGIILRAIAH